MIIRLDDFPTGIRPLTLPYVKQYRKILDSLKSHKVYLGIVPTLFHHAYLKKYTNIIPCMHGYDHCYSKFQHALSTDPYNTCTVGVFDEFKDDSYETILKKLTEGKRILEDFFQKEVKHFIPVCNILNERTAKVCKDLGLEILGNGDYYGKLSEITTLPDRAKQVTLHITWEAEYIDKYGLDSWLMHLQKIDKKSPEDYKILYKFPTRGRPDKFFKTLDKYYELMTGDNYEFLIVIDTDDNTMNNISVLKRLSKYKNLNVIHDVHKTKIEACNNLRMPYDWDILVLVSDDMIPQILGYDDIIRESMAHYYPNTDGVLWFNDGYRKRRINTLSIMGRQFYERFGYVYHPDYKNICCDREFQYVADLLGKQTYFPEVIIKHEHPANDKSIQWDATYEKNVSKDKDDYLMLEARREKGYDLERNRITAGMATFKQRYKNAQIVVNSIAPQVDELWIYDNSGQLKLSPHPSNVYIKTGVDLKDNGKFAFVKKGFYLALDDDIIYPNDYVRQTIQHINGYKCVVSWHGKCFKRKPITKYYDKHSTNEISYNFEEGFSDDNICHVLGSGVCGFHSDYFTIGLSDFRSVMMADLWLSKKAKKDNVRMICIGHPYGYLRTSLNRDDYTICQHFDNHDDSEQVKLINSFL